jgi:hypothetical protein
MITKSDVYQCVKNLLFKGKCSLTEEECYNGIKEACDFFGMPMPQLIQDVTGKRDQHTGSQSRDLRTFFDDILYYNLEELKTVGVDDYTAFTLVFTHECAHRYFQNRLLPGPNFGQWEGELVADFFMGVRASLQRKDISKVINGLASCGGSGTHPIGFLRRDYIVYGMQEANFHLIKRRPFDIEDYFQCFLRYRLNHLDELRKAELTVY